MTGSMKVAIPVFPRFTALDAVGPYEVLQRIPTLDVTFVGHERGEVRTENGMLGVTVDATFEQLPAPDVIVFPGGVGSRPLQGDERVLAWLREAHPGTRFTTSVCTMTRRVLHLAELVYVLLITIQVAAHRNRLDVASFLRRFSHSPQSATRTTMTAR